jgi:hypothetical protein
MKTVIQPINDADHDWSAVYAALNDPQADWSKAVVATLNQGVIEFSDGSNSCKASKNDLMQR